jgi:predicted HTH domain antitoxin
MQLTLQVADSAGASEFDVKMCIAAKLFESGRLSSGQAAETVGVSKRAFIELLGQYGVSVFQQTPEEIALDAKNAGKLL